MIGLPCWNVSQGHGSLLTFEFGEPKLEISERHSPGKGVRRYAYVHGDCHLCISCCHWRALQNGTQLAWSEDTNDVIARAAARLNGQKLLDVSISLEEARSTFTFDLGGSLETWPYGSDPTDEQWFIMSRAAAFSYRADGGYSCEPNDRPLDESRWLPLRAGC